MSFDWHQYLDLAQELAGQPQTPSAEEARLRSAASRAYYGAYCAARNRLEQEGDTTVSSQRDGHVYVWNKYQSSPEPERREIAHHGWRLRQARISADYKDSVSGLPSMASKALLDSGRIFSCLAKLK